MDGIVRDPEGWEFGGRKVSGPTKMRQLMSLLQEKRTGRLVAIESVLGSRRLGEVIWESGARASPTLRVISVLGQGSQSSVPVNLSEKAMK